jgi:hypothetical protein
VEWAGPLAVCSMWAEQLFHRPVCLHGPDVTPVDHWLPFLDTDGITKYFHPRTGRFSCFSWRDAEERLWTVCALCVCVPFAPWYHAYHGYSRGCLSACARVRVWGRIALRLHVPPLCPAG